MYNLRPLSQHEPVTRQTEHFLKFDFMSHIHLIKSTQKVFVKGGKNLEETNQISRCQLSHVARSPGFLLA